MSQAFKGQLKPAAFALSLALVSGCSLKDPDQRLVQVALPSTASGSAALSGAKASQKDFLAQYVSSNRSVYNAEIGANVPTPPRSFDEFTCFGLNVRGPGIGPDPRVSCGPNTERPMIIAGLAQASGGMVQVSVPAGSAREVQVFALKTDPTVGCPSLDDLLSNKVDGGRLGDFYLVGSAVTDIKDDTTISVDASFDPTKPTKLFRDCHDKAHDEAYLAKAIAGSLPGPSSAVFYPIQKPLQVLPSGDGSELQDRVALSVDDLSKLAQWNDTSSGSAVDPFIHSVAGPGATQSRRAVVQLYFDITDYLDRYTRAELQIQVRGGVAGPVSACQPDFYQQDLRVAGGVYYPVNSSTGKGGYFIPTGNYIPGQATAAQPWGWAGMNYTPVPIQELAVTGQNGRKYIIANIESSFLSPNPTCKSSVQIMGARLRFVQDAATLAASAAAAQLTPNPIYITSNQLEYWDDVYNVRRMLVRNGGSAAFTAQGGVPPFTWSKTSTAAKSGTLDPVTGYYKAPAPTEGSGMATITVTDSTNVFYPNLPAKTATFSVRWDDRDGATIRAVPNFDPTVPLVAGNCYSFSTYLLGHDYQPAANNSDYIYLAIQSNAEIYHSGMCASYPPNLNPAAVDNTQMIVQGTNGALIEFRPHGIGAQELHVRPGASAPYPFQLDSRMAYRVQPGGIELMAARMRNARSAFMNSGGAWHEFELVMMDKVGNVLPNTTGGDLHVTVSLGGVASLPHQSYDGGSTSQTNSYVNVLFPNGEERGSFWLAQPTAQTTGYYTTLAITSGLGALVDKSQTNINYKPAGGAAYFDLVLPTSAHMGDCVPVKLLPFTAQGLAASNWSGASDIQITPGVGVGGFYADPGCGTFLNSQLYSVAPSAIPYIVYYKATDTAGTMVSITASSYSYGLNTNQTSSLRVLAP